MIKLRILTTREIDICYAVRLENVADLVNLLKDVGMDFEEFLDKVDDSNIKDALLNLDDEMEHWVKQELLFHVQNSLDDEPSQYLTRVDETIADERVSSINMTIWKGTDVSMDTINKALIVRAEEDK